MHKLNTFQDHLSMLKSSNPKLRTAIINHSDPQFVKALIEALINLIKGNIPLSTQVLKKLKSKRKTLIQLNKDCCKKNRIVNIKKGRQRINQIGGIFPFIIPPLLALVGKAALTGVVGATAGYATKKAIGY